MKITFHKNPQDGAEPHTVAIFVDGEPATFEQLDAILLTLNDDFQGRVLAWVVRSGYPEPFKECPPQ